MQTTRRYDGIRVSTAKQPSSIPAFARNAVDALKFPLIHRG
jgi:hypothetical protein